MLYEFLLEFSVELKNIIKYTGSNLKNRTCVFFLVALYNKRYLKNKVNYQSNNFSIQLLSILNRLKKIGSLAFLTTLFHIFKTPCIQISVFLIF